MSPKRGQMPSHLGPKRFFTVALVVYAVGAFILGFLMLSRPGDWAILVFALATAPIAVLVAWEHERQYRRLPPELTEEERDLPPWDPRLGGL